MRAEGFLPNPYEWWHFTAPEWRRYPLADVPLPAVR
jgi:D-alanyl-D-alanine dipeptidase